MQSGGASKGRDSGYDRQRGGVGAMGGSGEKALETQRRLLRDRMAEVNRQLKDVERRRGFQRGARNRRLEPTVALVGYTNVGKSSLLNRLALSRHSAGYFGEMSGNGSWESGGKGSGGTPYKPGGRGVVAKGKGMVHARNRVFDTLDPTVRSITLPSRARCCVFSGVSKPWNVPLVLCCVCEQPIKRIGQRDVFAMGFFFFQDSPFLPKLPNVTRTPFFTFLLNLEGVQMFLG